uniref:Uncharacterized protein n=1 Tax=Arundo donax TaxID=35708 RepID=A0A0A8Z0V7_ARUDO
MATAVCFISTLCLDEATSNRSFVSESISIIFLAVCFISAIW